MIGLIRNISLIFLLTSCQGQYYYGRCSTEKEVFYGFRDKINQKYKFVLENGLYVNNPREPKKFICGLSGVIRVATVEDARDIAVECIECLVKHINSLNWIREQLPHHPINTSDVTCDIEFDEKDSLFVRYAPHDPYISRVFIRDNTVHYYRLNPEYTKEILFYSEPYETAREIVARDV
jgi:hypothetical protein